MKFQNLIPTILAGCFAWCILSLVTGCIGIGGGDTQPTLYYTLAAVPAVEKLVSPEEGNAVVGLGKVEIPEYLDRKEIIVRTRHNELRYTANHLWAERPGDSLPRVLAQNIERQINIPAHVYPLPWPDIVKPALMVLLEVQTFEGQEAPEAAVLFHVNWMIQSIPDGTLLKQGNHLASNVDWVAGDYSELADKLSSELATAGRLIGMDVSEIYETLLK